MALGVHAARLFMLVQLLGASHHAVGTMDVCKSPKGKSLSYCGVHNPIVRRQQKVENAGAEASVQRQQMASHGVHSTYEAEEMKEILATAKEAPAFTLAQLLIYVVVGIWKSLGTELLVFAITVGFAVSARTHKGKRDGGGRACEGASERTSAPSPSQRSTSPAGGDPHYQESLKRGVAAVRPSAAPAIAQPAYPTQAIEAWRIIDEIVCSCRANANLQSAHRAIALYKELQLALRQQGTNVGEATWSARYSASDLYACMVQSVIRTSQCHLVERLIDDMVRQGVSRPLAFYESTMKQLAVQKQHMLALSVYDRLQVDGVQPSVVMLSCLVSFASEVGAYDRAIDFFQQLSNQAKPSIRAYMTVLRVHGKRQDWAASLATFREMQAQGVPLDSLALNVVLSTAIAADKMEDAQMLICEGHETLPPISDNVSYNTLIKGYLQRSDLANAIKVVDRMREYGIKPNQITFNTMMDKAMRSFQRSEAWNLYAMMRDSGLKPDKLTCSILIKGMDKGANHKHIADCVELLQEAGHLCDPAIFAALKGVVRDAALQAGETELLDKLQQMRTMPGRFFSS
jgi:pentatricopeptide repeat protein